MNHFSTRLLLHILALAMSAASAPAFDWKAAGQHLGAVEVKDMTAVPLAEGKEKSDFSQVPSIFTEAKASIFRNDKHPATVEYSVTKSGWVFVTALLRSEGRGGEWEKERWTEKEFAANGWIEITDSEMGGPFLDAPKRPWPVFAKELKVGTSDKLRVNKYGAPRFLVLTTVPAVNLPPDPTLASSKPPAARGTSTPPAPAPAPAPAPSAPAPAPGSPNAADLVKANRSNLVFVTTSDGAGSGFIAHYGTGTFLITNAHVAAGAKGAMFKSLDGTQVQVGAPAAAVGHDIFLMALHPGGAPLEIMVGVDQEAAIGDPVVVLGNAEGAGVINTIQGKIVGVGPNLVEVDAPFQPGNSGSPIIHLKTGKVIGVATYLTIRKYDSATKQPVKDPIVRRFGYRLDSIKSWQAVSWQSFYAQATEMEGVEKLTNDLVSFLRQLSKEGRILRDGSTNPAIKNRVDQWLESRSKHLSPRDAAAADQSLLSFLKVTCQADITAAQQHLTYDYFQRGLADQQRERKEISDVFSNIIDELRK